jgi:ubiquinone/menaquinone biosynthesis C-methylase UbiE
MLHHNDTRRAMNEAQREYANDYVEFWNDTLAWKFERFREILMNGLSYHSEKPLDELALPKGTRILDVGCGWGDTAIRLARMTGPKGYVLGVDCVDQFLEKARKDAAAAGLANVEFVATDVETHPFSDDFEFCFSRFGMMFFNNPVAAMRNIQRALKPGGKLMFIVWRRREDNPWVNVPRDVVLQFLPEPGEDARTCGPGPFSMADPDTVTRQLEIAGFSNIEFDRTDGPVTVGESTANAIDFQLAIGPAGEIFREAGEEAEARRGEIEEALSSVLADYLSDGKVVMPSSSWVVTADRPD